MTSYSPKTKHSHNNDDHLKLKIIQVKENMFFQIFTIFFLTVVCRLSIFYNAYWNESIRVNSLQLDIVRHSYFVEQTFNGIFGTYVLPSGEAVNYSPVTPVIISILAFIPKYVLRFSWYHSTLIAASLLMGLEAIGVFLVFNKLKINYFTSILLIVFNPFELLDVMTWGGLSLILTMTCIAWISYLYIKITETTKEKQKKKIFWMIIIVLALISAFAHRTGFIIQILTFLTFLYKYRNYVIRFKIRKTHYLVVGLVVLFLTVIFIKIRKISLMSLSKLYNLTPTIKITYETIPIAINMVATWVPKIYGYWIIVMSFMGLLLYGIFVPHYWEENFSFSLNEKEIHWHKNTGIKNPIPNIIGYHLPRSYLIVTAILFLYPWNPGGLRARFLASASTIYLAQVAFVQQFITNMFSAKKKGILLVIYYLGLIINSIFTYFTSIDKINWVIQRYG